MTHTIVHGVAVVTQGASALAQDDWDAWLKTLRSRHSEMKAVIVYTADGGPSGKQRSQIAEVIDAIAPVPPVHVFTASAVTRGIVTALSWFMPSDRRACTHPPEDLGKTLVALGLSGTEVQAVHARIQADLELLGQPPAKLASG